MRSQLALLLAAGLLACGEDDGSAASDVVDSDETVGSDEAADSTGDRHPLCDQVGGWCGRTPTELTQSPPVVVAPSGMMPPEVISQVSHNNLDIAWHDDGTGGRLFFAFRTAPNHYASSEVVMYVVSTVDLTEWRFEGRFALETDLREPQLLSFKGRLWFYFVELGSDIAAFEPQGVHYAEWLGPGRFSEVKDIFEPGFLVWRIKDDLALPGDEPGEWAYAFGYQGGENIYEIDGDPIEVRWLRSHDGIAWEPVAGDGVVLSGGTSETDAVVLDDGTVIAVARNEAGDESGFGSKICRGEVSAPTTWTCRNDKRKYDSPMVFRQGDAVWLIARRNVTGDGAYDLGEEELPLSERYVNNQFAYWTAPKRCALWTIDPEALEVTWQADLPSAGDTCFPEAIRLDPHHVLVFNYSSPTDLDPDPSWSEGQLAPTHIYWTVVGFPM